MGRPERALADVIVLIENPCTLPPHIHDLNSVATVSPDAIGEIPSVRRPGGGFMVALVKGQLLGLATLRVDHKDLKAAVDGTLIGDLFPLRRPSGRGVVVAKIGQPPYIGAVVIHHKDLRGAAA